MGSFDQVMPLNSSGNEVGGFITAMNREFYIHLVIDNKNVSKRVTLRGCPSLHELLKPVLVNLEQHLQQSNTIEDMLCEIQNAIEQQICAVGNVEKSHQQMEYSVFFEQLQACGWEKVHYISPDFTLLHLKAIDSEDREHILKVHIPEKFPMESPKYECDLPQEFTYKWLPDDSLSKLLIAFEEKLEVFNNFWKNMEELDSNTWILEPENPRKKDCKRRIVLASGISLLLVIDPLMPTAIPTCHYLGPERIVEPVREKFNKNIQKWSEYDSVFTNLQNILELEFPSSTTAAKEEFCIECGICYSYLLGESIPDMTCDNNNCNLSFHRACLYEYIRMLPDVKTSFNKLFGHCPYCSKPMWCTVP